MLGKEDIVRETIELPDEIRKSKSDPSVYLFYKSMRSKRWSVRYRKKLLVHQVF